MLRGEDKSVARSSRCHAVALVSDEVERVLPIAAIKRVISLSRPASDCPNQRSKARNERRKGHDQLNQKRTHTRRLLKCRPLMFSVCSNKSTVGAPNRLSVRIRDLQGFQYRYGFRKYGALLGGGARE
jgi:hypothetical protein